MRLYSPSNSGVVMFRLLVVVGGKYDVRLVSPILRGFWYIWTRVSCNCENPPLRPLPSFLSFVLSELISPAPSVTMSSNLHQLSPDSPPSPVVNPIHVPPYSPNAPPSTGRNPQMTIPTYQPNPPVTNFSMPYSHRFGYPQSHAHPMQFGDTLQNAASDPGTSAGSRSMERLMAEVLASNLTMQNTMASLAQQLVDPMLVSWYNCY